MPSISPRCNLRSKCPASNLASGENGGVFISPSNQTSGLSTEATNSNFMSYLTCCQYVPFSTSSTMNTDSARGQLDKRCQARVFGKLTVAPRPFVLLATEALRTKRKDYYDAICREAAE